MSPGKVLFVLADGARARLVEQTGGRGGFTTIEEIDGRPRLQDLRRELRASPPARSFESFTPMRHSVGREDSFRKAKEDFVSEVAERAGEVLRQRKLDEVFVAAPSRLLGLLRQKLGSQARLVGSLDRDLTKSPDAALSEWLGVQRH